MDRFEVREPKALNREVTIVQNLLKVQEPASSITTKGGGGEARTPQQKDERRWTMIQLPRTLDEVQALIRDRVAEDVHLDYKRSEAIADNKKGDIAKDVSAFLNSDGGVLIYGVEEDQTQHAPVRVDDGVDHTRYSREWLEQVIGSNIQPRIDGVEIVAIPLSPVQSIYAVGVP